MNTVQTPSFLIIRFSSLGDILLLTPALRCLRREFPSAQIDVVLKERYRELLAENPHVDDLILLPDQANFAELKELAISLRSRYQTVVDMHTGLRSFYLRSRIAASQVLKYRKQRFKRWVLVQLKGNLYPAGFTVPGAYLRALAPLGVRDDGEGLEWLSAFKARPRFLEKLALDKAPDAKPIAICPGASFATKRWFDEYWAELIQLLLASQREIWIFGDNGDVELGQRLQDIHPLRIRNFCGSLGLLEAGVGLSCCEVAITLDAGPSHMAAAVGVPVVTIFGPTVTAFGFRPFRIPHRVAETSLKCRPCSHLGGKVCPLGHHRCMKDVTPAQVLALVHELWSAMPSA
ncbi:MAG: glycosyltransferase family 9 protein [bacterium]